MKGILSWYFLVCKVTDIYIVPREIMYTCILSHVCIVRVTVYMCICLCPYVHLHAYSITYVSMCVYAWPCVYALRMDVIWIFTRQAHIFPITERRTHQSELKTSISTGGSLPPYCPVSPQSGSLIITVPMLAPFDKHTRESLRDFWLVDIGLTSPVHVFKDLHSSFGNSCITKYRNIWA